MQPLLSVAPHHTLLKVARLRFFLGWLLGVWDTGGLPRELGLCLTLRLCSQYHREEDKGYNTKNDGCCCPARHGR